MGNPTAKIGERARGRLGSSGWLGVAASVSATGVLLASTVSRDVGGPVVVAGWVAFLVALHRFGRGET